jgi:flagellar hook-associated protein 3 FlgL
MRVSTRQSSITALNAMLEQQTKLNKTQLQVSSGKRIQQPSDDPIGMSIALGLKQQIDISKQFNRNGESADHALKLAESALVSSTDILSRTRELTLQGLNGTLNQTDRESLATEIERRLDELVGLGNTQLGDGQYLFSGFMTAVRPFTKDISGNINYNGDQGKQYIDVNTTVRVQTNLSGSEVFVEIPTGNGSFQTTASTANNGTGVISAGSIINPSQYLPDVYTVNFSNNGGGQLVYSVVDSNSNQIVPTPPLTVPADAPLYIEQSDIEFNGIQFSISGRPVSGDSFTIEPSSSQDLFTTVQEIVDALRMPNNTPEMNAALQNRLNNGLINLDRAMEHIDENRAILGSRLNVVESEKAINENVSFQAEASLSLVEDLDYAEAITRLTRQQVALQAAQQSFVKVQNLSLFQFIS